MALDHLPEEAALLLTEQAAPPPEPPTPPARGPRWRVVAGLLVTALAFYGVDVTFSFYPAVFSATVPALWLGALLAVGAGRAPGATGLGCATAVLGFVGFFFLGGLELAMGLGPASVGAGRVGLVSALIVALGFFRDRAEKPAPPPDLGPRITPWIELLRAVAADVAPGRRVTGGLDLRGAQLPEKLTRSGKAASGAEVSIYRDEWLRLRLPLRDGSQLRIAAIDRVKARGEYWKQGSRRRKLKPGRSERLGTLEVQLVVPPSLYRPRSQPPAAAAVGALAAGAAVVEENRATIAARLDAEAPAADDVVALAARCFAAFERAS
ncbi:MAG: hypothetical protein KJ067_09550 [Vicinamibacteria bacterium]|nr:hypothetical protein [Vicinamibacteria bacterium]